MPNGPNDLGFFAYKPKHLRKINALRQASSLVQISTVPILEKGQVLFSPASSADSEPRSCYNCHFFNLRAYTCQLMGGKIRVEKFVYPLEPTEELKPIEYWPVCGMWDYGTPNSGFGSYKKLPFDDPDNLGFGWVNAPEVGLPLSGTSCGGGNDSDECDHYLTTEDDKRAPATGFCRVLQTTVGQMDCCAAWEDDDFIDWQKGQSLLQDLDLRKQRRETPALLLSKQTQMKGKY